MPDSGVQENCIASLSDGSGVDAGVGDGIDVGVGIGVAVRGGSEVGCGVRAGVGFGDDVGVGVLISVEEGDGSEVACGVGASGGVKAGSGEGEETASGTDGEAGDSVDGAEVQPVASSMSNTSRRPMLFIFIPTVHNMSLGIICHPRSWHKLSTQLAQGLENTCGRSGRLPALFIGMCIKILD